MKRFITYTICILLCWGCEKDNLPPQQNLIPEIRNTAITSITDSSAICTFKVVNMSEAIHAAGVMYGTEPLHLTDTVNTSDLSGGDITLRIDNLMDDMAYHYKAYVCDKMGTYIYSEANEFSTKPSPYGSVFSNGITPAGRFRDGDGTQESPFIINNAQQLKKLVDDVNNGKSYLNSYFKLTTDIQVTANEWIPIGHGYQNTTCFRGNFDGNSHTISDTLTSNDHMYFGFFGRLMGGARISNLTIAATVRNEGNSIPGVYNQSICTGAIAGASGSNLLEGTIIIISNCHITGKVIGANANNSCTGGVIGSSSQATIQNCDVSNNITDGKTNGSGGYSYTGGVIGVNNSSEIINCTVFASAIVTRGVCDCSVTGGIVGGNYGSLTKITNCTNNAAVSGRCYVGGVAGRNFGEIHTSLNTGNLSSDFYLSGGLTSVNFDYNYTHVYSCCTNRGTVDGQAANANNQIGSGKAIEPCPNGHTKR